MNYFPRFDLVRRFGDVGPLGDVVAVEDLAGLAAADFHRHFLRSYFSTNFFPAFKLSKLRIVLSTSE
jgi:hypothetical protein